jgi:hypothetical protein
MDILQEKWYGGLPCFKLATEIAQPQPLGVAAVTGQHYNLNFMLKSPCAVRRGEGRHDTVEVRADQVPFAFTE